MKCKNIECSNQTINGKIYCSLSCRSTYVNKYLRDYNGIGNSVSAYSKSMYYENPNYCKTCNSILDYKNRHKKYCNKNCLSIGLSGRKHTEESKLKLSKSLTKYATKIGLNVSKTVNCLHCNLEFKTNSQNKLFCSKICKLSYKKLQPKVTLTIKQYRLASKFQFNLASFPEEFDFELIKKYGWYSPTNKNNNLGGVSRDHKYSVKDGYKNKIDPYILAHPANCQLLIHTLNISKNYRSSISLEKLLEDIQAWDKKYTAVVHW